MTAEIIFYTTAAYNILLRTGKIHKIKKEVLESG